MKLPTLAYLELASNVLPLGSGLLRFRRLHGGCLLFFGYILLNVATDCSSFLMGRAGIRNLWVLQIDHLLEFGILSLVLAGWQQTARARRWIYGGIPSYLALWIVAKFTLENFREPDLYTHTLECVVFIFLSVVTLLGVTRSSGEHLVHDGRFLLVVALLIYFGGEFLLFIFWKEIAALGAAKAASYWVINWSLNIVVNALSAVGLWVGSR